MNKINKINVCCQKVLPLVYDESLSYYEVLCKVIQKLNELIKINNNIRGEIHKEYVEILEAVKTVTETVASVTAMRDEVLTLKQATEQYAHDVVTAYNETVQARDTAIAKAKIAEQSANTATQKANSASQSATVATTKASEAQTSANNAKKYADEAKESASLVGQDVIQLKADVRNLQTSVNENTTDISSLTTEVNNNTSDISSLTTEVNKNTSNISMIQRMVAVYWKTIYPVGSIYISTNSNFNPNTTWGGTWRKTAEGRCLIGANDTYPLGSTGGEATHKHTTQAHALTYNEAVSHAHRMGSDGGSAALINSFESANRVVRSGTPSYTINADNDKAPWTEMSGGGNAAHSHGDTGSASTMQPYLAVYIWERIN